MPNPLLSILTSSVLRRWTLLQELIILMDSQIKDLPVEHLVFIDNKKRSIGSKRQALLDLAQGDYLAFVDDDDVPAPDYVREIMTVLNNGSPDLVVFPIRVTINGGQDGIVEPSVKYAPKIPGTPLAVYKPPVTNRPPHHLCVWRASIAKQSRFPDQSGKEDFIWAEPLWPLVKKEVRIDKVLYWWDHQIQRREHKSV